MCLLTTQVIVQPNKSQTDGNLRTEAQQVQISFAGVCKAVHSVLAAFKDCCNAIPASLRQSLLVLLFLISKRGIA